MHRHEVVEQSSFLEDVLSDFGVHRRDFRGNGFHEVLVTVEFAGSRVGPVEDESVLAPVYRSC